MSDRLKELQRQRALMREHLAWLDREIARETGTLPATPSSESKTVAAIDTASSVPPSAADILSSYSQETPGSMAKDAKRGCIISFVAAFALLALGVTAFYLLWKR